MAYSLKRITAVLMVLLIAGAFLKKAFANWEVFVSQPEKAISETISPRNLFYLKNADVQRVPISEIETSTDQVAAPSSLRGIYLSANTVAISERRDQLVAKLVESDGNAVVIDIEQSGGQLAFTPKSPWLSMLNPGSALLNDLPVLIAKLHQQGIYVIARQVIFNDPFMAGRQPDWRIKTKKGVTHDPRWLDPSLPIVQQYNLYVLAEVAKLGFDEIQFDYIRFPANDHPALDYYYDETKFTRSDVIIDFLKKAHQVANAYHVALSVDVFGGIVWGNVDWQIVGQDVSRIAEYVDAIYPMTYPSHYSPGYYGYFDVWTNPYNIVHGSIERFQERAQGKTEIRPWIQGFPLRMVNFSSQTMKDQVRASYDAGSNDFMIWSPGNIYTLSWPSLGMEP